MKKTLAIFVLLTVYTNLTYSRAESGTTHFTNLSSNDFSELRPLSLLDNYDTISTTIPELENWMIVNKITPVAEMENISSIQFKYSMMMDVNVETLTDASLYNFIDNWFGTRYRMGGTSKKGIDCSAFTSTLLLSVYSLAAPRTAKQQYAACTHISKEDLSEGDLVFFHTKRGVSHVGVYLANGYFVHSCCSQGVSISNLQESYYSRKFIGAGRLPTNSAEQSTP